MLLLRSDKNDNDNVDTYELMLEYILIQLNEDTKLEDNSIILLTYAFKHFVNYEQTRVQMLENNN